MTSNRRADASDALIMRELQRDPDQTTLALATRTGLSRNTVATRLARYAAEGTLRAFDRRIDPAFLGYPLRAYILTKVTQRKLQPVAEQLSGIPEVLEVSGISGAMDLIVQVAARDADHLYAIAGRVLDIDGVKRTSTGLVMRDMVEYRITQLLPETRQGKGPGMR